MQQQQEQQQLQHQQNLQQQKMLWMQQEEKELERRNLAKIMQHRQQAQTEAENNKVFHFPQVSGFSTSEDQPKSTYSVDKNFIQNLEKDLGTSDAMANMLGPNPQTGTRQRTSPRQDGGRPLSSCGAVGVTRPTSRTGQQQRNSGSSPNQRLNSSGSSQSKLNTSGGSEGRREEARTAHVKPFVATERSQGPAHNQGQQGMGDVMGAAANWRPLAGAGGRTDLLAGQRSQLGRYTDGGEVTNQRNQGGGRYTEGEAGSRGGGTNAMEINKIAQCSKMVPGMSGSEIRASLEAVNWDTNIAVKNLKIDKLYRIGVATKPKCEKVLQAVGWDLEQAASRLLDAL